MVVFPQQKCLAMAFFLGLRTFWIPHVYVYIYIYIYVCMYVCVSKCMCVCVCVNVCVCAQSSEQGEIYQL